MFGRGLLKLIGLAIAGAFALAGGAQILSSVAAVVIAARSGDVFPLFIAIAVTLLLIRMKRKFDDHPIAAGIGVLAYAGAGYLSVVAFIGMLPLGLIASLLAAAVTITSLSVVHDPGQLRTWAAALALDAPITWGFSISSMDEPPNSVVEIEHRMMLLSEGSLENVVKLMKARPLLPISLMHLEDIDVLCIAKSESHCISQNVRDILTQYGVFLIKEVSPFLREALLKIPILDTQNGLGLTDYVLVRDTEAISHLLEAMPPRMRVFPSKSGLRVLYPESEAPGLLTERVADSLLVNAVFLHDYTAIQEVRETESSA
ncbi:MAG: hypothetical protein ACFFD6_11515 [Candidatus Thorarchaeota archaeon]